MSERHLEVGSEGCRSENQSLCGLPIMDGFRKLEMRVKAQRDRLARSCAVGVIWRIRLNDQATFTLRLKIQ